MFDEVSAGLLREGYAVRFRANGASMTPTIRDGEVVRVEPVAAEAVGRGDVLMYLASERRGMIAHRVLKVIETKNEGRKFLLRGDATLHCDGLIAAEQIVGRVSAVERDGCKVKVADGRAAMLRVVRTVELQLRSLVAAIRHPQMKINNLTWFGGGVMRNLTIIVAALFCICLFSGENAFGQVTLTTSPFIETFDNVGTGLPSGFTVRTGATATSLGATATFNTAKTNFGSTGGQFANYASADGLTSASTTTAQSNSTDRVIGLRQTDTFGDPGASINFNLANTVGRSTFTLSFKAQTLSEQTRTTTYTVQYGLGTSPSTFVDLATYTTGAFGSTTITITPTQLAAIANQSQQVQIRIVALTAATGAGSRDTFAIDDFSLSFTSATTNEATNITNNSATLNGTVNANGVTQTVTFQYDDESDFGDAVTVNATPSTVSGTTDTTVSANIAGLASGTTYFFRVVTSDGTNTTIGSTLQFTTDASPPTAVNLINFTAITGSGANVLRWQTGYEVNNLGFNIYRYQNGTRTRVNPSLIAGSALLANAALTAGQSYTWTDTAADPNQPAQYYLEDVDLSGARSTYGPVVPTGATVTNGDVPDHALDVPAERSLMLNELRTDEGSLVRRFAADPQFWAEMANTAGANVAPKRIGTGGVRRILTDSDAVLRQRAIAGSSALKISVRADGLYRLTLEDLRANGFDVNGNAAYVQLYRDGIEQPVRIDGAQGGTGALTDANYIEFFGRGMDAVSTDTQIYYFVTGAQPGRRFGGNATFIGGRDGGDISNGDLPTAPRFKRPGTRPLPKYAQSFRYTVERRDRSIYFSSLLNGDASNFFGAVIFANAPVEQTLNVRNVSATGARAVLDVAVQGVTKQAHIVKVLFNDQEIGTLTFDAQGRAVSSFDIAAQALQNGDNKISLVAQNGETDISLLDYARITYSHQLVADNDALSLLTDATGRPTRIEGFTAQNIRVFDVTNTQAIDELNARVERTGDTYSVTVDGVAGNTARTLVALRDDQFNRPAALAANQPSNLSDTNRGADFVILTHKDFRQAVEPLAELRRRQGLNVAVVDIEDVYDEFSFGAHTPDAITAFFRFAATNWQNGAPRYALLVGDATYDPRNYTRTGDFDSMPARFVDTSLMETASDDAYVDFNVDGVPDVAIGRLPVRTVAQATLMVSKITNYAPSSANQSALFVADNKDGYDFEAANTQLAGLLPQTVAVRNVNRAGRATEEVHAQILGEINQGAQVINYSGHGSVEVWTGAGILSSADAPQLNNGTKLPVFVALTCLNGFFQDVARESLAEAMVKAQTGGAVAAWASSSLTEPEPQLQMAGSFYAALYGGDPAITIGDAIRQAKAATTDMDVRRTWIFFGDPTMRLR